MAPFSTVNVTVPAFTGPPLEVTLAVRPTGCVDSENVTDAADAAVVVAALTATAVLVPLRLALAVSVAVIV
jgi:hypothetical protein